MIDLDIWYYFAIILDFQFKHEPANNDKKLLKLYQTELNSVSLAAVVPGGILNVLAVLAAKRQLRPAYMASCV